MSRREVAVVGVIGALLVTLAVLVAAERTPASRVTAAPASPPLPGQIERPEPAMDMVAAAPAPLTIQEILPTRPGERTVARVRLRSGEIMTVSAGTTVGDDLVVDAVGPRGVDVRINGALQRVSR